MIDKEDALAVMTRVTPAPYPTTVPSPTNTNIMADMRKEMAMLIAASMSAAASNNCGTTGSRGSRGSGSSKCRHKTAYRKDKDGNDLPKCPHCNKAANHKPDNCFSLPKNTEKMKTANFVD